MPDNIAYPIPDGTVVATDDDGTAEHQYVKLEYGADGTFTKVAAGASALPIQDGGNSITVDFTALPAGTNNIGDVDVLSLPTLPAGTNNIGDVDILSLVPGTGATSLGKAEDAAHASGDTGVMALAVRKDTPIALASPDGDYTPLLIDSVGRLHVTLPTTTVVRAGPAVRVYDTPNQSLALSASSQALPSIPGAATHAEIQAQSTVSTDFCRFWPDGTAPTSSVGFTLISGETYDCMAVAGFRAINSTGSITLRIAYYHIA